MKVLSIICQKGGTAKTTTAINLAVEAQAAGLETVIIDLDPQVSAYDWKDMRGEDAPPTVATVPVSHLERTLKAARENGAELVIIDTAGRTNDAATAAARVADAILIPMQPSLMDMKTLQSTLDVIAASGSAAPIRVVLTRVKAAGTRHETTASWLADEHREVCPVMLGDRFTYQDAYAHGKGVTELDPGSKAAEEVRELYKYTVQLLNMSTKQGRHDQAKRPTARVA